MRALVTGSHGTVGTALAAVLREAGWEVVAWDRREVAIDDYARMDAFVSGVRPDAVFHLAVASQPTQPEAIEAEIRRVDFEWPSELAWITRQRDIAFVHTSTAMVFSGERPGPYTIASVADAEHGYGRRKAEAEARVLTQNPGARIARLGWQIGEGRTGNHMTAWLARERNVRASVRWLPACAFVDDTARALLELVSRPAGIYHLDSNDRWSFFDIADALRRREDADWSITASWDRAWDQRLVDGRVAMPPLHERLPELLGA